MISIRNYYLLTLSLGLIASSLSYSFSSFAQATPDSGQILREQRQLLPQIPGGLPPKKIEPIRPAIKQKGAATVKVRSIRFTGDLNLVDPKQLQEQVSDYIGRTLNISELEQLADDITRFLRSRGWLVAQAYLPEQDVTDGDIKISILRGRIEGGLDGKGIKIDAQLTRFDKNIAQKILNTALIQDAKAGLRSDQLERGILLLNDLPGISARANLEKGTEQGTTRVGLQLNEGPLLTGSVTADNHGSRYTGTERLTGQFSLNDPFGIGDQANLTTTAAERLSLAAFNYSLPIGYSGVRLGANITTMSYELGQEVAANENKGTANTWATSLFYPIIRSRSLNLSSQISYELKALRDESNGSVDRDRRIQTFPLSLTIDTTDAFLGGALNNFSLVATAINADYSRVSSDVTSDQNAQSGGASSKLNFSLGRLQKITDETNLYFSVSGQLTKDNLPSSEKFMLGGATGIRAYPGGEASGDAGILSTLELRRELPDRYLQGKIQVFGFVDAGQIAINANPWPNSASNATNRNRYELAGAGFGINYGRVGAWNLKAVWAHKIGSNPGRAQSTGNDGDGQKDASRAWLQAILFF